MKLAITATCSNETRYLLEWVAWHSLVGFDRIFIHLDNNDDTAEFRQVRAMLEKTGIVEFIDAEKTGVTRCIQMDTYCTSLEICRSRGIEWLLPIDLDEYLVLSSAPNVGALVANLPHNVAQVTLSWLMHGSAGETEHDPSRLHFEKFNRTAKRDHPDHLLVKSMVRVPLAKVMGVHLHNVSGRRVDASGKEIKLRSACITATSWYGDAHVAHFSVRSRGEFNEKCSRGYASSAHTLKLNEDYWNGRDANDLPAPPSGKMCQLLRARIDAWQAGDFDVSPNQQSYETTAPFGNYRRTRPCF